MIHSTGTPDSSLYLVATGGVSAANQGAGDNPAIALITVVGSKPPAKVVINEMTTVASVWTNAQFLDDTTLQGQPLSLRIAAGNVPNFVDLETGGWGDAIQSPLNSSQTPTMANFATLADLLSGLRDAGEGGCLRKSVRGRNASGRWAADQHAERSRIDRT